MKRRRSPRSQLERSLRENWQNMATAPDSAAMARELAAGNVGFWHGTGSASPCCTTESWYNIHPLADNTASGRYRLSGWSRVRFLCLPMARVTLKGERAVDGTTFSGYRRNESKQEFEPGGAPTRFNGTLQSIADGKATYKISPVAGEGGAGGVAVIDVKNRTETVEMSTRHAEIVMHMKKVSDEVQPLPSACGCIAVE